MVVDAPGDRATIAEFARVVHAVQDALVEDFGTPVATSIASPAPTSNITSTGQGHLTPSGIGFAAGPPVECVWLPDLQFATSTGQAFPMPTWARALMALGHLVAATDRPDQRALVVVGVPTLTGAPHLVSLGAVAHGVQRGGRFDVQESLEELRQVPEGTMLELVGHGRTYKRGRFRGVEEHSGEWRIVLDLGGRDRLMFLATEAPYFRIASTDKAYEHAAAAFKGKALASPTQNAFIDASFGDHADSLLRRWRHDCTVVSPVAPFQEIADAMRLVASDGSQGTANDLLRIAGRGPLTGRTEVVSPLGGLARSHHAFRRKVDLVVFGSPAAYAKWGRARRGAWRSSNAIVLVDMAAPRVAFGMLELEEAFGDAIEPWIPPNDLRVPDSIVVRGVYTAARRRTT
jgi:hypothetical protein